MDDLHDRMEDLARRVDTAAAPDLEQVRERHTRRRRTSGLVVGVALAAIVALLAVQMARPSTPSVPAASQGPSSDTLTVWPDAETGDEPWRASPEQLITRFAKTVLGWSTPDIRSIGTLADPGEDPSLVYELRPEECPATARCTPPLTVSTVETTPGVWSVQAVTHPDLDIEVGVADPAVALTGGSKIHFELEFPEDRAGHIGMVASNGCRDATSFEVGLDAGSHVLELPAVTPDDPACEDLGTGYLFAYAMDDTTVPTGDPLLEAAAIEYPWLTVVPIYFQMEESDPTSTATPAAIPEETLTVGCGSVGTELQSSTVAAGPMGVAVEFVDAADPFDLRIDDDVTVSDRHVVLDLEPGAHEVHCFMGDATSTPVPFEVVDSEGYWLDPSLDCAPPDQQVDVDADVIPTDEDPTDELISAGEQIIEDSFTAPGSFTFGGYPDDREHRTVVLIDVDGAVLARADFDHIQGEWYPVSYAACGP